MFCPVLWGNTSRSETVNRLKENSVITGAEWGLHGAEEERVLHTGLCKESSDPLGLILHALPRANKQVNKQNGDR